MKREFLPPCGRFYYLHLNYGRGLVPLWGLVALEFGMATGGLYIVLAFLAGIASFFAPCAFALLPGYASYYLVLGMLVYAFGSVVSPYLRYFKPLAGLVFLLLGMALYSGYS